MKRTTRRKAAKTIKFRLRFKVSFLKPFGFPSNTPSVHSVRNNPVLPSFENVLEGWIPVVLLDKDEEPNDYVVMKGTRPYMARSSAETAARLFIQYVKEQMFRPKEPLREHQLFFVFEEEFEDRMAA